MSIGTFTVTLSVRDSITGLSGDGVTSLLRHLMALLPGHIATHLLGHRGTLLAGHLPRHLLAVLLGHIVTLLLGGGDTLLHLSDFTTFYTLILAHEWTSIWIDFLVFEITKILFA